MVCIIRLLSAKSLFPGGNLALENVIFNDGNFFWYTYLRQVALGRSISNLVWW